MTDTALRNLAGALMFIGLALGVAVSWWITVVLAGAGVAVGIHVELRRTRKGPRTPGTGE